MGSRDGTWRALTLGAVSGLRSFGGLGPLGARGLIGGRLGRIALPVLLAGELAADKHPAIPPRSAPPSLSGRIATGALAGWTVGGLRGARLGAAGAAATTHVSQRGRKLLGERTGLPDPVVGLAEDALAVGVAAAATRGLTVSRRRP